MTYLPIPAALVEDPRLPLRFRLWLRQAGNCHWCGRLMRMWERRALASMATLDHVVPCCKGGSDDADNIVAACLRCNVLKGDADPAIWRAFLEARAGDLPERGTPEFSEAMKELARFAASHALE